MLLVLIIQLFGLCYAVEVSDEIFVLSSQECSLFIGENVNDVTANIQQDPIIQLINGYVDSYVWDGIELLVGIDDDLIKAFLVSDESFEIKAGVRIGSSRKEVIKLLGPPEYNATQNRNELIYTKILSNDQYGVIVKMLKITLEQNSVVSFEVTTAI